MSKLFTQSSGSGPDLVLIHGWGLHAGVWDGFVPLLEPYFRVLRVDLPGHGNSGWSDETMLDGMAAAVLAAAPASAAWLGWSLGGLVALRAALLDPSRVRALVLLASTPCFVRRSDWQCALLPALLDTFAAELQQDYLRTLNRFLALQVRGSDKGGAVLRMLRAQLLAKGKPVPEALRAGLDILRNTDLREGLGALACPVLVVAGERDTLVPGVAATAVAGLMPNATVEVVAGAGHAPFIARPEAVAGLVRTFLKPQHGTQAEMSMPEDHDWLDKSLARRAFERAAGTYDASAVLQNEVGGRLVERLDLIRMQPRRILDLGAGTGVFTRVLGKRYRKAVVTALDIAPAMLRQARARGGWWRRPLCVCADAEALPFTDASFDFIFSNLMLQWCADLHATLLELRRVLAPGGLLMFTTLGPDTLGELRASWSAVDGYTHVNPFIDMHDVGDALLQARWAEPVMDMERLTVTYHDLATLMLDLKHIGAHNVTRGRARGLTGKRRFQAFTTAYEAFRRDGVLPSTYEVIYGHAWSPQPKNAAVAAVTLAPSRRQRPAGLSGDD